jgi:hypothetical protein
MRRPLLAHIDSQVDIVKNAVLALQLRQGAALQEARGTGLQLTSSVETTMRVDCKCREITHAYLPDAVCYAVCGAAVSPSDRRCS